MTREDIIRMAREAGIDEWWDSGCENWEAFQEHLERFFQAAYAAGAAAERSACAAVVEQAGIDGYGTLAAAVMIRTRGAK